MSQHVCYSLILDIQPLKLVTHFLWLGKSFLLLYLIISSLFFLFSLWDLLDNGSWILLSFLCYLPLSHFFLHSRDFLNVYSFCWIRKNSLLRVWIFKRSFSCSECSFLFLPSANVFCIQCIHAFLWEY